MCLTELRPAASARKTKKYGSEEPSGRAGFSIHPLSSSYPGSDHSGSRLSAVFQQHFPAPPGDLGNIDYNPCSEFTAGVI